jgi:cytochrome P450
MFSYSFRRISRTYSNSEMGSIILRITYGYKIDPHSKDPLVKLAEETVSQFSKAIVPGAFMVDIIPALKYLPDWLPGTGFKKTAKLWNETLHRLVNVPYSFAKAQANDTSSQQSFVSNILHQKGSSIGPEDEHELKWAAAAMYGGGADTSVSTMMCFFLAMSIWPDVQRKAWEEIDRVVGSRLPTTADRVNLPYLNAVMQEAFRWHPVAPLGNPHTASKEAVYRGYRIPKGATLMPNIWWFTHDPEVYHDPMEFKPERYLEPYNEPEPSDLVFGFGRRICPGRLLAESSVFLTVARSLAVFKIQKAVDDNGNEIEPEVDFEGGIISHPLPYKCRITARTAEHDTLIRNVEVEHPWEEGSAASLDQLKV